MTLRGRPKLNLDLERVFEEVRCHGQILAAAREPDRSQGYIHERLKEEGLTLRDALGADSLKNQVNG